MTISLQNKLRFTVKKGAAIATTFEDLAALRIAVFREFPYLYEGSLAYEKEYLQTYAQAEKSFLFAVYDGTQMIGATTCLPLANETSEIRRPFELAGHDVASFFYFGESLLLPAYRGMGLGHRFFDEREAHARSFGEFRKACFFSVLRPDNHPARPADHRSHEAFWRKRGYTAHPELQATLLWPDPGATTSTPKQLICWIKDL